MLSQGEMYEHVGHRVSFFANGPQRGTIICLDCDKAISVGSTFGRPSDAEHQAVTGKLLRGGAVVDGVDIPSTFTIV